jgi:hypothetical protein
VPGFRVSTSLHLEMGCIWHSERVQYGSDEKGAEKIFHYAGWNQPLMALGTENKQNGAAITKSSLSLHHSNTAAR